MAMAGAPDDWEAEADRLAADALATGDPTAWFERLYRAGDEGRVSMPWDRDDPNPVLRSWTSARNVPPGGRALVVGCGLGADAGHLAGEGWATTAFDIAPTAIEHARRRWLDVEFAVADVFDLPSAWRGAFDLVVEIYTVQALPAAVRPGAIAGIAGAVAPGGTLLIVASARDLDSPVPAGPPWPLTETEVRDFAADDLDLVALDDLPGPPRRWRAELVRPS